MRLTRRLLLLYAAAKSLEGHILMLQVCGGRICTRCTRLIFSARTCIRTKALLEYVICRQYSRPFNPRAMSLLLSCVSMLCRTGARHTKDQPLVSLFAQLQGDSRAALDLSLEALNMRKMCVAGSQSQLSRGSAQQPQASSFGVPCLSGVEKL